MGKGLIISGGDDGLYSVQIKLNKDRITAIISKMEARITYYEAKEAEIQAAIDLLDPETSAVDIAQLTARKNIVILEKIACQKRIDYLNKYAPEEPTVSAWCLDLTEDLSGNIGTIEIPGERGTVLIQPGYSGNAVYNSARDGQLFPYPALTPAGLFYNLAMLPGWQKWKPLHRFGQITAIDYDANTCTVALEDATSSQRNLDINQGSGTLEGVEINYMSCNAAAFEVGDDVVVEFGDQDWDVPLVIGFKDNPKPCGISIKLTRDDDEIISADCVFILYNSSGSVIESTSQYNSETQYWIVLLENQEDIDDNGYWLEYDADKSVNTQYPRKYKTTDKQDNNDLIDFGEYEDNIPYWETETTYSPLYYQDLYAVGWTLGIISISYPDEWISNCANGGFASGGTNSYNSYYGLVFNSQAGEYRKNINVKSSINYLKKYRLLNSANPSDAVAQSIQSTPEHPFGQAFAGLSIALLYTDTQQVADFLSFYDFTPYSEDIEEIGPSIDGKDVFFRVASTANFFQSQSDTFVSNVYIDGLDISVEYDF